VFAAIYRGCFDAFKAVKQLTDDYVGCRNQTWNNRVRRWCLCDTDLCNRFPIEQGHDHRRHHRHRLAPPPAAAAASKPYQRRTTHHHPLPPPQPAPPAKTYRDETPAGVEPVVGQRKDDRPAASYRTVWTNYHAPPANRLRRQPHNTDKVLASYHRRSFRGERVGGGLAPPPSKPLIMGR